MKYILTILFFFSTLGFGFAQKNSPLTYCPPTTPLFYIGVNTGVNSTKLNYNKHSTSYKTSYHFGIEVESYFHPIKEWKNSILYGVIYESKEYVVRTENSKSMNIESNYLTIPIKYNRNLFSFINNEITFNVQAGVFYSLLLNSTDDNSQLALPNNNYGIILGAGFTHFTSSGLYFKLDYNFQNEFAPISNTTPFSSNISHVINIGLKIPSRSIF